MKKILALFTFVIAFSFSSQAQIDFGVGATYRAANGFDQFGLQAKGYIGVTEAYEVSPTFSLWLGNGADWSIDTDLHYKLLEIGESFNFNPFAGLSFTNGGGETNVAINLGLAFKLDLSSGAEIYIEPKFVVIDNNSFVVSGGYLF